MSFLAIDPGTAGAGCAWAWFADAAVLRACGFARTRSDVAAAGAGVIRAVIVEKPQIDGRCPNPGDLLELAWQGAALAYSFSVPVLAVTPRTWKGSVPKPIHHARMLGHLSSTEWAILPAGSVDRMGDACRKLGLSPGKPGARYYGSWTGHNLLDAAALGVYYRELRANEKHG